MFSGASNLQQGNVHVIAELLAPNVHVVSDDDSGDHIDNEVRADWGHHEPLVAHYEEHEVVHLEPLAGTVLKCHDEAGPNVSRVEKVIWIMVDHY